MADLNVLDFDQVPTVTVRLGGRDFSITQQRTAIVQAVLEASSADVERDIKSTDSENEPKSFVQSMFSNWDEVLSTTALMLGCEKTSPDYMDTVQFLRNNLNPSRAIAIFEKWTEVNEIATFLERGGRTLMPRDVLDRMQAVRQQAVQAAMEDFLQKAREEIEPEGLAGTPPPTVN